MTEVMAFRPQYCEFCASDSPMLHFKLFIDAYMGYVNRHYCEQTTPLLTSTRAEQYADLQAWVLAEELAYKMHLEEMNRKGYGLRLSPPWLDRKWTFAKNVNFDNCLFAMSNLSKTFEMETLDETTGKPNTGFVKITGHYKSEMAKLTWLTNLDTYEGLPHKKKAYCKQKIAREEERDMLMM